MDIFPPGATVRFRFRFNDADGVAISPTDPTVKIAYTRKTDRKTASETLPLTADSEPNYFIAFWDGSVADDNTTVSYYARGVAAGKASAIAGEFRLELSAAY